MTHSMKGPLGTVSGVLVQAANTNYKFPTLERYVNQALEHDGL